MIKCNNEYALKTAVELAKVNIESSQEFVSSDNVTYFIDQVFSFLTGEAETDGE